MSVFTSRVTQVVEIATEAGASAVIRKLAPKHLEAAAKAQQQKSMAELQAIGGATFLKELQALGDGSAKTVSTIDPLLSFDAVVLLEKGLMSWTLDAPLTRESFEDLDDATLDLLARAVLRLAKPSLFQTAEETEAAQVKG